MCHMASSSSHTDLVLVINELGPIYEGCTVVYIPAIAGGSVLMARDALVLCSVVELVCGARLCGRDNFHG
jgi:hypothetical protein